MKRGTIVRDQHYRLLAKSGELHFVTSVLSWWNHL